jgi:hypothetical protein
MDANRDIILGIKGASTPATRGVGIARWRRPELADRVGAPDGLGIGPPSIEVLALMRPEHLTHCFTSGDSSILGATASPAGNRACNGRVILAWPQYWVRSRLKS